MIIAKKGEILVLIDKFKGAEVGAQARITQDYKEGDTYVYVEFIDEKRNGQHNGGYFFKDFELLGELDWEKTIMGGK